jgi:iron complex transport system substrate-binding protein
MRAAGLPRPGIVSLLPSATEIVCALGCGDRLKGRSHECDFPPEVQSLPVCTAAKLRAQTSSLEIQRQVRSLLEAGLSSIYQVEAAMIEQLRPDIILSQGQCEVCAVSRCDLEKAMPQPPAGWRPAIISLSPARLADVWKDIQTSEKG